jgi:uncharacterized protein YbaA (DUF1428 family)
MAKYVTYFIVPVPKKNLAAYKRMARLFGKVWLEHGALSYTEWVADDVSPGKVTSFPQSVKLKKGEVVVVGRTEYKSAKDRERVMAKVMSDPRLAKMDEDSMPFDGMRMFWGGFKPLIEA